jgi:valyl-tRNA synthetase
MQWFLKMENLAKPAIDAVESGEINIIPAKFKNVYRHWMENVRDWCISRQLWWGHRIPAFYLPDSNEYVVAETIEEALEKAKIITGDNSLTVSDLRQDEDVLDTWFSSWLWPISVFDGIMNPENPDYKYYYPTNDLVTAPEILFFWVARMIIAGYEYPKQKPFSNVYLHGIVRDKQRRKMSKSLGNSPDPLDLIDTYGADGVRVGMLLCAPAGGDLLYDDSLPEQGRNFANKIWNAFRLVKNWEVDEAIAQPEHSAIAIQWLDAKINDAILQLNQQFDTFRLSEALMTVYKLFWDDFSAWYLEIIKPEYQKPIDKQTYIHTLAFFKKLSLLISPFMPFITEELWQFVKDENDVESIVLAKWPKEGEEHKSLLDGFSSCAEVVAGIRNIRQEKNLPQKDKLSLQIVKHGDYDSRFDSVIKKLGNLEAIVFVEDKPDLAAGFIVKSQEYFIPLGNLIDKDEEIKRLEQELQYAEGFLKSVLAKLSNERFVSNAPEKVIEIERRKQADAESKIKIIQEQIESLR